jgi:hypothetical protein
MKKWIYEKSTVVFVASLLLYILIWCTVSYIGVQVTYVLGPIILISGLLSYFFSPSDKAA